METTLDNSDWDVVIAGTGLQQSLLALALSRSGKKILHVDENPYYSGTATALSVEEAEEWVTKVNQGFFNAAFAKASIHEPVPSDSESPTLSRGPGRPYNLALAPEITYSGSAFRCHLVSSQVNSGVGFLPVGGWWVYSPDTKKSFWSSTTGTLEEVPSSREDIFGNKSLDFPTKRKLVKFIRFVLDYESDEAKVKWDKYRAVPFAAFLSAVFKAPAILLVPLLALTMSTQSPEFMTTELALPRIARHLRSIGTLGKFSAVVPMYGGWDEFCQVACRACAVGGGIYILRQGLSTSDGSVSMVEVAVEKEPSGAENVTEAAKPTNEVNHIGETGSGADEHAMEVAQPATTEEKELKSQAVHPDPNLTLPTTDEATSTSEISPDIGDMPVTLEQLGTNEGESTREISSVLGNTPSAVETPATEVPSAEDDSTPDAQPIIGEIATTNEATKDSPADESNSTPEVQCPVDELATTSEGTKISHEDNSPSELQPTVDENTTTSEASALASPEPAVQVKEYEYVPRVKLHLNNGEAVSAQWVVSESSSQQADKALCKSITIVSSPLQTLFPLCVAHDGTYPSGAAVLVFPSGSLSLPSQPKERQTLPPVHIHAHSSASGECPLGQSVLYGFTSLSGDNGFDLLRQATSRLLATIDASPSPTILWCMQYEQRAMPSTEPLPSPEDAASHLLTLPPVAPDLVIDDGMFNRVRALWQTITNGDPDQFLVFKKWEAEDEEHA